METRKVDVQASAIDFFPTFGWYALKRRKRPAAGIRRLDRAALPNRIESGKKRRIRLATPFRRATQRRFSEKVMDITGLIIFLAIGAVAGWLASMLMKGGGSGLLMNIVLGIVGALVGGFVFGLLGISAGGIIGSIATATVGAVLLLFIVGKVKS
jgi:uncharacterized membrane protein YeaQ/YmgE (transglycosylase-associated protein family)